MKAFRVDLKAFLGLVLPTPSSSKKIEAGFRVILLIRGPCPFLGCPYYELLLWFMMFKARVFGHENAIIGTP